MHRCGEESRAPSCRWCPSYGWCKGEGYGLKPASSSVSSAEAPTAPSDICLGASLATVLLGATLLGAVLLASGCSGERYARPPGPTPKYEQVPLPAWDAGSTPAIQSTEPLGFRATTMPLHADQHR
jgi:hypothetical protein